MLQDSWDSFFHSHVLSRGLASIFSHLKEEKSRKRALRTSFSLSFAVLKIDLVKVKKRIFKHECPICMHSALVTPRDSHFLNKGSCQRHFYAEL